MIFIIMGTAIITAIPPFLIHRWARKRAHKRSAYQKWLIQTYGTP